MKHRLDQDRVKLNFDEIDLPTGTVPFVEAGNNPLLSHGITVIPLPRKPGEIRFKTVDFIQVRV